MSHQVRSWFGAEVHGAVSHPPAQALAAKWMQIRAERAPTLADFWYDADEAFLQRAILFLKSEQDYVYLHHGAYLQERIGFSMQGRALSELRTRVRAALMQIYDRSSAEFTPAYMLSFADFMHDVLLWGRLCLPLQLAAGDPRVILLVYCHPIVDKPAILRALFERATSGTIIATPIRNAGGDIVDGWIVALNDEAGRLTGVVEHASGDLHLRRIALFSREDVWQHFMTRLPQSSAQATIADRAQDKTYALQAEWLDGYMVFRVTLLGEPTASFVIE